MGSFVGEDVGVDVGSFEGCGTSQGKVRVRSIIIILKRIRPSQWFIRLTVIAIDW